MAALRNIFYLFIIIGRNFIHNIKQFESVKTSLTTTQKKHCMRWQRPEPIKHSTNIEREKT